MEEWPHLVLSHGSVHGTLPSKIWRGYDVSESENLSLTFGKSVALTVLTYLFGSKERWQWNT
jgi:hypothetical protein